MTIPDARGLSSRLPLLAVALLAVSPLAAKDNDVAGQALSVFRTKCSPCHGAGLKKADGDFGHVDDLERLSRDAKLVVPGKPEDSLLFQRIGVRKDMPPKALAKKRRIEAVSDEDIDAIRSWIAAGAPAAPLQASRKQ